MKRTLHKWLSVSAVALLFVLTAGTASRAVAADGAGSTIAVKGAMPTWQLEELGRRGLRVVFLGWHRPLQVPLQLRYSSMEGRKLVEELAKFRELKTLWPADGKTVVLYAGADKKRLSAFAADIRSSDVAVRESAAWRARWLRDVETLPDLVKAAADKETRVAKAARESLRILGWDAVLAVAPTAQNVALLDIDDPATAKALAQRGVEKALDVIGQMAGGKRAKALLSQPGNERVLDIAERLLESPDKWNVTLPTAQAIGKIGDSPKARELIEKAWLVDNDPTRQGALLALADLDGEKAFPVVVHALIPQNPPPPKFADPSGIHVKRYAAALVLNRIGGAKALPIVKHFLEKPDGGPGGSVIAKNLFLTLGDVGGDEALNLIESVLASPVPPLKPGATGSWYMGTGAVVGAGQIGGPRALRSVEKGLDIPGLRAAAAWSLGFVGDEKAVALLEKAVTGENRLARRYAAMAAGTMATGRTLPALERLAADPDAEVRATTAWALAQVGGPKALALLAKFAIDTAPDPKAKVDVAKAVRYSMAMIGGEREWDAVRKDNMLARQGFLEMLADYEEGLGSFRYWNYVGFAWE